MQNKKLRERKRRERERVRNDWSSRSDERVDWRDQDTMTIERCSRADGGQLRGFFKKSSTEVDRNK
jgi:hypothetical protein